MGGEYSSGEFDRFLTDAGIRREHSIRNTPQQLGVADRLNRNLGEGITTLLSPGLSCVWYEDVAVHFQTCVDVDNQKGLYASGGEVKRPQIRPTSPAAIPGITSCHSG